MRSYRHVSPVYYGSERWRCDRYCPFRGPDFAAGPDRRIAGNLSIVAGLVRDQASSLDGRASTIDRDEVQTIVAELGGRVDAVARLHRLLAENPVEPRPTLAITSRTSRPPSWRR